MKKKVDKLKNLKSSVENFENSYGELIRNANEVPTVNLLGTMPEYPFSVSLDSMDIGKWTNKFKTNIDHEIIKELMANGELYTKEEMSKKLGYSVVSLNRKIKQFINGYKKCPYVIVKAKGSNGNRHLYTKDFMLYLQDMLVNKKQR